MRGSLLPGCRLYVLFMQTRVCMQMLQSQIALSMKCTCSSHTLGQHEDESDAPHGSYTWIASAPLAVVVLLAQPPEIRMVPARRQQLLRRHSCFGSGTCIAHSRLVSASGSVHGRAGLLCLLCACTLSTTWPLARLSVQWSFMSNSAVQPMCRAAAEGISCH
jgi:hypothetical protein